MVTDDEQPHKAAIEKIPSLRPAFAKDGTITAANSSSISDGASALVLMSGSEAEHAASSPWHGSWPRPPQPGTVRIHHRAHRRHQQAV